MVYSSAVDLAAATHIVTVVLAVLAITWHQQRSTDKLRSDLGRSTDKLCECLDNMGKRLSGIEGFLGIGMPNAASRKAPGATLAIKPSEKSLFGIDKETIEIFGGWRLIAGVIAAGA